jgi:hypothetical protein
MPRVIEPPTSVVEAVHEEPDADEHRADHRRQQREGRIDQDPGNFSDRC